MSKVSLDVAQRLDITCRKGDTFNLVINVSDSAGSPVNLSSYTFEMEIRQTDTSTVTIANSNTSISGGQMVCLLSQSVLLIWRLLRVCMFTTWKPSWVVSIKRGLRALSQLWKMSLMEHHERLNTLSNK